MLEVRYARPATADGEFASDVTMLIRSLKYGQPQDALLCVVPCSLSESLSTDWCAASFFSRRARAILSFPDHDEACLLTLPTPQDPDDLQGARQPGARLPGDQH